MGRPARLGSRAAAPRPRRPRSPRVCSGVDPQHDPAMLSRPARAHSPRAVAICSRRLVVPAELVGQAGVRVRRDGHVREPRQLLDVLPELPRPRAQFSPTSSGSAWRTLVQNASSVCPRQRATRGVGDRPGDDRAGSRKPRSSNTPRRAKIARLGVERVEDRLDEQQVRAAGDQPSGGLVVRLDQLLERHVARGGVVDVRRDGARPVGGAHRPGRRTAAARRRPPPRPPPRARAAPRPR